MTVYSDLESSIGRGISRTAEDFFNKAKEKFLIRVGNRKPKTALEKNIGDEYANTESGRIAREEYVTARLRAIFSNDRNVFIAIGVLFIIALLILRR